MALNDKIKEEVIKIVTEKTKKGLAKGINQEYVETLRDRIVQRTRLGIGVDPETGVSKRLKPLAEITKRVRKNEARVFSTKGGGKIVWTDGSEEEGISRKAKKARKDSFKAFFGNVRLSNKTTPSRSNLTATGQLLNSLTVIKLRIRNGRGFAITVGDRRGRDMFGNSSKIGNKRLVEIQEGLGRTFLGFTKSQRNVIAKEIRQFIVRALK